MRVKAQPINRQIHLLLSEPDDLWALLGQCEGQWEDLVDVKPEEWDLVVTHVDMVGGYPREGEKRDLASKDVRICLSLREKGKQ